MFNSYICLLDTILDHDDYWDIVLEQSYILGLRCYFYAFYKINLLTLCKNFP